MKPIHAAFRLMGLKPLLLGSSGEEGRRAADELARVVHRGSSATISPDGPYGPPRILKKGILHVALKSGVPIVPLTITPSRYIMWPSWDSKKFPLPFGRICVTVHRPSRSPGPTSRKRPGDRDGPGRLGSSGGA